MGESDTRIEKKYSFADLQNEMSGIKVGRRSFSQALRESLGNKDAVHWYYQTKIPMLNNKTPHEYIVQQGEKGKKRLSLEVYFLLTGQPD